MKQVAIVLGALVVMILGLKLTSNSADASTPQANGPPVLHYVQLHYRGRPLFIIPMDWLAIKEKRRMVSPEGGYNEMALIPAPTYGAMLQQGFVRGKYANEKTLMLELEKIFAMIRAPGQCE